MTRLPSRRLLALALASAIAMPALAQTTEPAAAPVAAEPLSTASFTGWFAARASAILPCSICRRSAATI